MPLEDIVDVTITDTTVVPTRVGFGTPLILSYHTRFIERSRTYSSLAGMVADGFAITDAAYKMATKIFSQSPRVERVIVGRCASAPTQIVDLVPVVKDSHLYSVTIDGITSTFTSGVGTTAQLIVEGLVADINADMPANTVIASEDNTKVTLTSEVAGRMFELAVDRADLTRDDVTADPGIVADLTAIKLYNDDWYTVHPTHQSTAAIIALAVYIETLKKIMITECGDDDILAGNGAGASLKASGYARTALMYHALPHQFAGAAWAGKLLPQDPGSATWKFKTLAGVTVDSGFSVTQRDFMRGDNVNYYEATAGISITQEGYSAAGDWIDTTQGIDWLEQIMAEDIFALLASVQKLPFTDPGIQAVEAIVRANLKRGIGVGFLSAFPEPIVTVPLAVDVSAADKAARTLPDVNFSATLAGAIHSLEINGTVSV